MKKCFCDNTKHARTTEITSNVKESFAGTVEDANWNKSKEINKKNNLQNELPVYTKMSLKTPRAESMWPSSLSVRGVLHGLAARSTSVNVALPKSNGTMTPVANITAKRNRKIHLFCSFLPLSP